MKFLISLLIALSLPFAASAKTSEAKNIPQLIQTLEKQGPSVVLFAADWCPHCKTFKPVYEKLSDQMSNPFLTIDMENPDMLNLTAGIPQIPTVVVMAVKNDAEGKKIVGCLVEAPESLEKVKASILKCLVNMK